MRLKETFIGKLFYSTNSYHGSMHMFGTYVCMVVFLHSPNSFVSLISKWPNDEQSRFVHLYIQVTFACDMHVICIYSD